MLPADIDGDGDRDLVALLSGPSSFGFAMVMANRGGGTFDVHPEQYGISGEDPFAGLCDVNGDGLPDLVGATRVGDLGISRFTLRLNAGGGAFSDDMLWPPIESSARSVSLADLNGDSRFDFIIGYREYYGDIGGVSTLLNTGPDITSPTLVSLLQASFEGDRIRVTWLWPGDLVLRGVVSRREDGGDWGELDEIASDGGGKLSHEDRAVSPGHRYEYRLSYRAAGTTQLTPPVAVVVPRPNLSVSLAGPNPARRDLWIRLELQTREPARIEVLDLAGRRVRSERIETIASGPQVSNVTRGVLLPSGVYWVRLTQSGRSASVRAVVMR